MNKKLKKKVVSVLILMSVFTFINCQKTSESIPLESMKIKPVEKIPYNMVVSVDMIRELGFMFARTRSNKAEVLIKPGINPLTYKATKEDEEKVLAADVFFYMGLGLEPGLASLIKKVKNKVRCIDITSTLDRKLLLKSPVYAGGYDPHIWWGPDVWEKFLLDFTRILNKLDPEGEYKYSSIYLRYGEATNRLNYRFFELWMKAIPPERRVLITLHPAFQYFGRLYDCKVKSILDPFKDEYSEGRINELADFIISNKVPVIFPEATYSHEPLEELKAAAAKKGYDVAIGPEIYSYFLAQDMNDHNYTYLNAARVMGRAIYDALKLTDVPGVPD
ncbi:MAG: zinc ABC transporter substrate-binding protein [Spirochaetales bacterium]|nr:zinc ABC transporter substrate-binding protein [Spirochaetales bacterium]